MRSGAISVGLRVAAPCAALVYPILIWAGAAISPILLAISLFTPAVAAVIAIRCSETTDEFRVRGVAHLAFAAPPMFSLLGVLLDFQKSIPLSSHVVWPVIWMPVIIAAARKTRRTAAVIPRPSQMLAIAHGFSAVPVTVFTLAHLANHLAALAGAASHIEIMTALRAVYRQPVIEVVLLTCILFQFVSGLVLASRKLRVTTGVVGTMQSLSGVYLALFLLSHLTAVLTTYYVRGVDTNFVWLTSYSLVTDPWSARLGPYYILAVATFGVHGAAGLHKILRAHGTSESIAIRTFWTVASIGTAAAALILAALVRS